MTIVHQYQFSSDLQRMSVIVNDRDVHLLFCKGSPEKIMTLCSPETIPEKFAEKLEEFTEKGYRVIAVAAKVLEAFDESQASKIERNAVERGLNLVGVLVMENKLKAVSGFVVDELRKACIKTVMITGEF